MNLNALVNHAQETGEVLLLTLTRQTHWKPARLLENLCHPSHNIDVCFRFKALLQSERGRNLGEVGGLVYGPLIGIFLPGTRCSYSPS